MFTVYKCPDRTAILNGEVSTSILPIFFLLRGWVLLSTSKVLEVKLVLPFMIRSSFWEQTHVFFVSPSSCITFILWLQFHLQFFMLSPVSALAVCFLFVHFSVCLSEAAPSRLGTQKVINVVRVMRHSLTQSILHFVNTNFIFINLSQQQQQ